MPDKYDTKKMLAKALMIAVKFAMKNNIYTFNAEGSSIGLEVTADVAPDSVVGQRVDPGTKRHKGAVIP